MKIIEQQVIGKINQEKCEDGIVVTPHFVAVIDGSTSKTDFRLCDGISNGRYCMQQISHHISEMSSNTSLQAFCKATTDFLQQAYLKKDVLNTLLVHPEQRPTASCVIYSDNFKEIWMIGDCQCLVNSKLFENCKPSEAQIATKRCNYLSSLLSQGKNMSDLRQHDFGRDYIHDDLIASTKGQNINFAVIDGTPIPIDKIKIINVKVHDEVVLASDGYPRLRPTQAESEEDLRYILSKDPMCMSVCKATKGWILGNKSFDDRAYIRFIV